MGSYFSGHRPKPLTQEENDIYKRAINKSFKAANWEDAKSMVLDHEEAIYIGRFFFSKITKDDVDKLKDVLGGRELIMVEDGESDDRYFDLYSIRDKVKN
jgi:hypothetical protein